MSAWRAALRGVPSDLVVRVSSGAPPAETPLQSPADQAAFELARPRSRFLQPIVLGGFGVFYVTMMSAVALGAGAIFVCAAAMGSVVAYAVARRRRELRQAAGRVLNSAFNLIGLGRLREASDVLDVVAARTTETWVHRLVEIQRATIAIRRGEVAAAELHLTAALDLPVTGFGRENALYQLEGARALRAFVRASLGQHDAARADIDEVHRNAASDDAVARVALAQAMILEQQGKREELRLLLADKSSLLLEHTHPRERAIVRAFQRMVRADKSSVYRRAESRRETTDGEEPMLADWVAKVAPGAASFVRSSRAADHAATTVPAEAVARPTENAMRANREAKRLPGKKWVAPVLGSVAAAAVIGAGYLMDSVKVATRAGEVASGATSASALLPILMVLGLAVPIAFGAARALRALSRRRAERAARKPAPGRVPSPPTDAQLRALTRETPSPTIAAQAHLLLADRAERSADFATALAAATEGLARLSDPRDRVAADIVYPDLVSLRAFALAAHGRFEEANAELATLGPAYPHYSRAIFRARLLTLVRLRDLRAAADWIDRGEADLPLSVREELLADLVRATQHPALAGAGEIQRLKDDLQTIPEARPWIRTAAPGLLEAFETAGVGDTALRFDLAATDATASAAPLRESDTLAEEEALAADETSPPAAKLTR